MPLFQIDSLSWVRYSTITLVWFWTGAIAAAQDTGIVYIFANQTSGWTTTGDWTLNKTVGTYVGNWLVGRHDPQSTTPTVLSFDFNGTALVVFGTVVNGTTGSTMNLNVKLDNDGPTTPAYSPTTNLRDGMDNGYILYQNGSLSTGSHTFALEITGEDSPFLLQGAAYTPSLSNLAATNTSNYATQSSSSDDTARLGGAIGGGLGALALVGIFIFFMMRHIRKTENEEKKRLARPFFINQNTSRSAAGTSRHTPSAPDTVIGTPKTRKKKSSLPSSDAVKRPLPSSSNSAPSSRVYSSPYSPPSAPHHSPVPSLISVPSEYQATTVGPTGGTAVASSYIGATPTPDLDDVPPVPPIPADLKRKSKASRNPQDPQTPSSGLGLFSTDDAISGLTRPLPVIPGTRSSAPVYSFPPEKVGLTPSPPRREASSSKRKKSRPAA